MDKQNHDNKKVGESYEIDNTIEWMMAELENCFARNINNHHCSAIEENYCSNKNMKHCVFYKPASIAIENMTDSLARSEHTFEKHPEYKLIAEDVLKITKANQEGIDVKKLTLKEIMDFQKSEKKKRKQKKNK